MKRLLLIALAMAFFLVACSTPAEKETMQKTAVAEESRNVELLEQELHEISEEEWQRIYLSKDDFDQFLADLSKADEDGNQSVESVEIDQDKLTITLNNKEGESLENLFTAPYLDTLIRRAYTHSAYLTDGQPTIKILDLNGTVLSENKEPMDSTNIKMDQK